MMLEKLIKACRKGDIKAQKQLYSDYKDVLYILCLKYSRNKQEAEDVLHDSFMVIFNSIKKYKGNGSFEGWMKRITINTAITSFKKNSTFNILINEEITKDVLVDEAIIDAIPLQQILKAVQGLPDRYRVVFNLYELDNYTHKEIAEMLDVSIGTSKSNLHRAKILLRKKLEEWNNNNLNNRSYGN